MAVENELIDFLMERSYEKKYSNYQLPKLVNCLLKAMIESSDLEIKLRMICKANESEAISFLMSVCSGKILNISKFSGFLDEDTNSKINLGNKLS